MVRNMNEQQGLSRETESLVMCIIQYLFERLYTYRIISLPNDPTLHMVAPVRYWIPEVRFPVNLQFR